MSDSRIAVMHVINKFKVKNQKQAFRCIMIYQDLDTGFCFVRPLLYKIDLEIVMELFKMFTSYGPPDELHVNSCTKAMVDNIDACMRTLCPMFNITFLKKNADNNDTAMKVVSKLHSWMEVNCKEEWEIGCAVVQREMNTAVSAGTFLSPHERFFKELGKANTFTVVSKCSSTFTEIVQDQNRSNVTQKQNIRPNAEQEQNVDVNFTLEKSSGNLLNDSLDTMKIKKEIVDTDEDISSISNRMQVFEGGLILPCLKEENIQSVEVKMERLDRKEY